MFEFSNNEYDSVCRMIVSKKTQHRLDYHGKTYYFCSENCKEQFNQNPENFIIEDKKNNIDLKP